MSDNIPVPDHDAKLASNEHICDPQAIATLLENGSVQTFFQPLVAVNSRRVLGFEAYARGVVGDEETVVKPQTLFDSCHDAETQLRIDQICRKSALEQFRSIYKQHPGILLFLNINVLAMRATTVQPDALHTMVTSLDYDPRRVIIEVDAAAANQFLPKELMDHQRQYGFRFSIDDCTLADLELLHRVRPDYLKIGRSAFQGLSVESFKREIMGSLLRAAADVGCEVAAKGVETEDEAFALLDNRIYLQQGFFFTKKKTDTGQNASQIFQEKIKELHSRYKQRIAEGIQVKKAMFVEYHQEANRSLSKFEKLPIREFSAAAKTLLSARKDIMAVYVLDDKGTDVAPRLIKTPGKDGNTTLREVRTPMDHSIQDYFLHLKLGFERFVTRPFVSPNTKKRHCILSRTFYNIEGRKLVFCVEFPYREGGDETLVPAASILPS